MIWVLKGYKGKLLHSKAMSILAWVGPCLQGTYGFAKEVTLVRKFPKIFMEEVITVL